MSSAQLATSLTRKEKPIRKRSLLNLDDSISHPTLVLAWTCNVCRTRECGVCTQSVLEYKCQVQTEGFHTVAPCLSPPAPPSPSFPNTDDSGIIYLTYFRK